MSYVENNLGKNEVMVKKADRNGLFLLATWIKGILFCWLLLIPTIKAIIATIRFNHMEIAVTNKRVVGKVGVLNTQSLDSPLNKIQNVGVKQTFGGKIFNYGNIEVTTAAGKYAFDAVKDCNDFKGIIMGQIEQYEEDRIAQQASQMAQAMANAINK